MNDYSKEHITKKEIEEILSRVLSIKISDDKLFYYQRALVHCSVPNDIKEIENPCEYLTKSNERLEHLGDSMLDHAVRYYLFFKYSQAEEGKLTKYCSRIVCGKKCSEYAEKIGIKGNILMSDQTRSMGGIHNVRFLEDAFEALIGAIGIDHGFDVVYDFVVALIENYVDEDDILTDHNYKDALLRHTQKQGMDPPEYIIISETGKPNEKEFTVVVNVYGGRKGKGRGSKLKDAQQVAAKNAIRLLEIPMN